MVRKVIPYTSLSEWLAIRAGYLTASDIGAAVGTDKWKSPLRVYAEKAGEIDAQRDTAPMKRGRWLEHAAVAGIREEHPDWRVVQPRIFVCDDDLRLGATPDALTEDEGGLVNLQIKATSPHVFEEWDGVPPMAYQLQVVTENMLLDAARGMLVVLVADSWSARLEYFDIPRHANAEARICEVAQEFWANLHAGLRPRPDFRTDGDTIDDLYPANVPNKEIDLSADNRLAAILEERAAHNAAIKAHMAEVDALEVEVKDKLGDAERALYPGWKLSWKTEHRKGYEVAPSVRRVLRIRSVKERERP
jgi:predicted phage-related endonuclease